MPTQEEIDKFVEDYIMPELEFEDRNICLDDYFKVREAFRKMLDTKKTPEYSVVEYEYLFKLFYEEYKNKIYKKRTNINEIIGGYGELLFYNKLLETAEGDVIWVSRYHGDRFGFDFLVYNDDTKEFVFYEVKTTINKDKLGEFYLTENEYKKYKKLSSLSLRNENIKFIIANILIDDKGIIDEVDYSINDDMLHYIETNKTVIKEHKDKITYHREKILEKRLIQKPSCNN